MSPSWRCRIGLCQIDPVRWFSCVPWEERASHLDGLSAVLPSGDNLESLLGISHGLGCRHWSLPFSDSLDVSVGPRIRPDCGLLSRRLGGSGLSSIVVSVGGSIVFRVLHSIDIDNLRKFFVLFSPSFLLEPAFAVGMWISYIHSQTSPSLTDTRIWSISAIERFESALLFTSSRCGLSKDEHKSNGVYIMGCAWDEDQRHYKEHWDWHLKIYIEYDSVNDC